MKFYKKIENLFINFIFFLINNFLLRFVKSLKHLSLFFICATLAILHFNDPIFKETLKGRYNFIKYLMRKNTEINQIFIKKDIPVSVKSKGIDLFGGEKVRIEV